MADQSTARKKDSSELFIKLAPMLVIVIALSAGVYFLFFRGSSTSAPPVQPPARGSTALPAATEPTTAPAGAEQLNVEQLLKESSTALKEQRLVAPAGNNALEFYLQILEKEPKNQAALDALRELLPFATGAVEQNINAGQLDEAKRVIDLLAKNDPANYTLTILRSRMEAKRKVVDREQAQLAAAAAAAAAANKPVPTTTGTNPLPPPKPATTTPSDGNPTAVSPPKPAPSSTDRVASSSPPVAVPPPSTQTSPPPPVTTPAGETHDVVVVKTVPPEYPRDAVRKRQEGWVEVEFTVTTEGQATDARVVSSEPGSVFDHEAVRAVQRWTFKPKMENGKPEASRVKRRIEFKLNG